MDPRIAERYNDRIFQTARRRHGIAIDKIALLDGF